jgi:telomere length regulation protein
LRTIRSSYPLDSHTESSSSLLGRLVTVGAFPAAPPAIPTIPSFWATILSRLRQEFIDQISGNRNVNEMPASRFQKGFISSLSPLPLSQQLTVINSLLSHLEIICKKSGHEVSVGIDSELDARGVVKREAELISYIVGDFYAAPIIHQATSSQEARRTGGDSDDEDLDDFNQNTSDSLPRLWSMVSVILGRPLSIELPRLLVCWAGISRHREQGKPAHPSGRTFYTKPNSSP